MLNSNSYELFKGTVGYEDTITLADNVDGTLALIPNATPAGPNARTFWVKNIVASTIFWADIYTGMTLAPNLVVPNTASINNVNVQGGSATLQFLNVNVASISTIVGTLGGNIPSLIVTGVASINEIVGAGLIINGNNTPTIMDTSATNALILVEAGSDSGANDTTMAVGFNRSNSRFGTIGFSGPPFTVAGYTASVNDLLLQVGVQNTIFDAHGNIWATGKVTASGAQINGTATISNLEVVPGGINNVLVKLSEIILANVTGTVSFTGIPNTYRSLRLTIQGACDDGNSGAEDVIIAQFNGDTGGAGNYGWGRMRIFNVNNTVQAGTGFSASQAWIGVVPGQSGWGNGGGQTVIEIVNYATASFTKTYQSNSSYVNLSGGGNHAANFDTFYGSWNSVAPITSILLSLAPTGQNFLASSVFTLYGLP